MGFEIKYNSSTHTRNRRQSLPCTPPDQSSAEFTYFPTTTTHSLSPPPTPTRTFPDVSNNPPIPIHLPTHYEKKLRRRDSTVPAPVDARAKRVAARKLALLFAACFTGTYLAFLIFTKRHAPPPPKVHKIVWYAAPSPNVGSGSEAVRAPAADRRWEESAPYRPAARRPPTGLDGIATDHDIVRSRADAYRDAAPIIRRRAPTHDDADRPLLAGARNAQNIPPPLQVEIVPVAQEPELLDPEERGTVAAAEDPNDDDAADANEVETAVEPEPEPDPELEPEPAVEEGSAGYEEATVEEAVWAKRDAIPPTQGKRAVGDTPPPVKEEADHAYGSKAEYLQHQRDVDADRLYQAELARRESHDLSGRPPPANRNRMRQMNRGPPPPRHPMDSSSTTARKSRAVDTGDTDPRSIPRRVMKSPSADLTAAQVKRASRGRKGKGPQRAYVPHERDAEEHELPSGEELAAAEATQRLESRWGRGEGEDDGDE